MSNFGLPRYLAERNAGMRKHMQRSWPEDFAHENGCYCCKCLVCDKDFTGHKRRVVCRQCGGADEFKAPDQEES